MDVKVKAFHKDDWNEGWDETQRSIDIIIIFTDSISINYKITHIHNGYDSSIEKYVTINLLKNNKKMYQHKKKNQKNKDYCIINNIYYAGSKEDKIINHWTTILNNIKNNFKNNFEEIFPNLEKL